MKEVVTYIGILSNVNASILKLPLSYGFRVKRFTDQEFFSFLQKVEHLSRKSIMNTVTSSDCLNFDEKMVYYIEKSIKVEFRKKDDGSYAEVFPAKLAKLHNQYVNKYLIPKIQLLRLYKEGNIVLRKAYYALKKDSCLVMSTSNLYASQQREMFSLKTTDIKPLKRFLNNSLPFKHDYIQLAFESFERSYDVVDLNLSFLSLMICVEVLFSPDDQRELRYRISRNIAVLLGKNKRNAEEIFKEFRLLYDQRSKIVHSGKSGIVQKKDVNKLRLYVREAIKAVNNMKMKREEVLVLLNVKGFGQK